MISVGIDVSKGKSTVTIMKPGGEIVSAPYDVLHNYESLNILAGRLNAYDDEVRVVLEATGNYHLPVVVQLTGKGIFVCVENALRMKKYNAQNLRGSKTDDIDSLGIASYGLAYWNELTAVLPVDTAYSEIRTLSRQYYQFTSLLIKSKNNLINLLDQVMPDINALLKDSKINNKLTDFVARYFHFENIVKMGKTRFVADYCKWAKKQGYRDNERKATAIFALAQNGIPVLANTASTKIAVSETVRVLQATEKSRNTILTQLKEIAKTLPEYYVVLAMGGVGETLAPRLIAEVGDVRRFRSKHSLIAYAGIDVPVYQSGKFTAAERHITKRGNKYLRKTGYEVMQSLTKHKLADDVVFQFIQSKRSEGKAYKKAAIAGLNKFLRIYYARVSELYDEITNELVFTSNI